MQAAPGHPVPPGPREQPDSDERSGPGARSSRPAEETQMTVMAPTAVTGTHADGDLMTRRQVAYLFRVTSSAVAIWARRGRLPEVRDEAGRPRYRRADVDALMR